MWENGELDQEALTEHSRACIWRRKCRDICGRHTLPSAGCQVRILGGAQRELGVKVRGCPAHSERLLVLSSSSLQDVSKDGGSAAVSLL